MQTRTKNQAMTQVGRILRILLWIAAILNAVRIDPSFSEYHWITDIAYQAFIPLLALNVMWLWQARIQRPVIYPIQVRKKDRVMTQVDRTLGILFLIAAVLNLARFDPSFSEYHWITDIAHQAYMPLLALNLIWAWYTRKRRPVIYPTPANSIAGVILATGWAAIHFGIGKIKNTTELAYAIALLLLTGILSVIAHRWATKHTFEIGEARFDTSHNTE